jgi:2,3-bisphosphoglycerate-independent phosphoglycerate mutase
MSEAIRLAYATGQEDETLEPLVRIDETGSPVGRIQRGDAVVFYNIRGEREVELSRSLTEMGFFHFPVVALDLHYATMIEYDPRLEAAVAFPPEGELRDN